MCERCDPGPGIELATRPSCTSFPSPLGDARTLLRKRKLCPKNCAILGFRPKFESNLSPEPWSSGLFSLCLAAKATESTGLWRRRVEVESTIRPAKDRIAGFEGRGDHRTPFAPGRSIAGSGDWFLHRGRRRGPTPSSGPPQTGRKRGGEIEKGQARRETSSAA